MCYLDILEHNCVTEQSSKSYKRRAPHFAYGEIERGSSSEVGAGESPAVPPSKQKQEIVGGRVSEM